MHIRFSHSFSFFPISIDRDSSCQRTAVHSLSMWHRHVINVSIHCVRLFLWINWLRALQNLAIRINFNRYSQYKPDLRYHDTKIQDLSGTLFETWKFADVITDLYCVCCWVRLCDWSIQTCHYWGWESVSDSINFISAIKASNVDCVCTILTIIYHMHRYNYAVHNKN